MRTKCIKILLLFISSCCIAYLIGQKVVLPLTDRKAEQNAQKENQQDGQSDLEIYDLIADFASLSLTGESETDENPWGSNLTTFEDEDKGTCLLMTPGTEIAAQYVLQGQEQLSWNWNIHPWMAEISDGADVTVSVSGVGMDRKEIIRKFQVFPANADAKESISLTEFQDKEVKIRFSVGNGENNDSSGDWLVFERLLIEPMNE